MNIPVLSLKDVTALHGDEINEAVQQVVDAGWYLQGGDEKSERNYARFIGTTNTQHRQTVASASRTSHSALTGRHVNRA